jgi:subtilisin family serine protease
VTWNDVKFYEDFPTEKPLQKPDVSAPASGFPVWSRNENLRPQWSVEWQGKGADALIKGPQGNSFAGPHVAGVAALMLSVNPELNAWQVKRIIEQTCKDIGAEGFDFEHGHGVVQAHAAVQAAKKAKT